MAKKNNCIGFVEVNTNNVTVLLPISDKEPHLRKDGQFNQGYFNILDFSIIHSMLNSDLIQAMDIIDKVAIGKAILEIEQYVPASHIMEVDEKLDGDNWACINSDTGITCPNRVSSSDVCPFCNHCYAFKNCRNPSSLKKQLAKMVFFHDNSTDDLATEIINKGSTVVRINQEGEFNSLMDYLKFVSLANKLPDVSFYGYTKNQIVLDYIAQNGLPKNLIINNSLGNWADTNYIAVKPSEIAHYLKLGYLLCKGSCANCRQCLTKANKVTILRDGTQKISVRDLAQMNHSEQLKFFEAEYL